MYLLTPYLFLRLWWKGRKIPAYRQRINERFCLGKMTKGTFDVWVHAVSLGEVIASTPLIEALLAKKLRILITSMTPTGAERVRIQFGERVTHRYIPYDLPDVLGRFFKAYSIKVGVIVETELWPNLINQATNAKIPLFLVNARLSERSCQGYKKIEFLIKPVLNQFKAILAQSADDALRFKQLGADEQRVAVFGNVKFDLQTKDVDVDLFQQLKKRWDEKRVVVIAASTHDNEEELILANLKNLQAKMPNVILLIAARHPERFTKVYELSRQMGFNTSRRSQPESLLPENEVVVLDSLGELLGFYHISDYAFVGGSFVPVGGHNVLEPIAMHVPVLCGPHVHNFKTICHDLQQAKAIELVSDANALMQVIGELHGNNARRTQLVNNASEVLIANKGAVTRYANKIVECL